MKALNFFYGLFLFCFIFSKMQAMDIEDSKSGIVITKKICEFNLIDGNTPTTILQLTSKILIFGSKQGNIFIWNIEAEPKLSVKKNFGHSKSVTSLIKINNDTFISSSKEENTSKMWDIEKEEPLAVNQAHTSMLFFPPNTSIGLSNSTINTWNILKTKTKLFFDPKNNTLSLEKISHDQLLAGCCNGVIKLWNIHTKKIIRIFQHPNSEHPVNLLTKISNNCFASACSTSARYKSSFIYIWNIHTGECIKEISYNNHKNIRSFCSSYNTLEKMSNELIVSGSYVVTNQSGSEMCDYWEYLIKIWDIKSGLCTQEIHNQKKTICDLRRENPEICIEIEQLDKKHWILWVEKNGNIVQYNVERI
jgi:WD40 repeat protein